MSWWVGGWDVPHLSVVRNSGRMKAAGTDLFELLALQSFHTARGILVIRDLAHPAHPVFPVAPCIHLSPTQQRRRVSAPAGDLLHLVPYKRLDAARGGVA